MKSFIINLLDISESGKEFTFKKGEDKELDTQLSSVIDDLKNYSVKLTLTSAGDIYTAIGQFVIQKGDQCSLCAEDLVVDETTAFTEYLVLQESDVEGHAPHSGLNYETTQETYFIESLEFDVFSFLREIMAAAISLYPKCKDTDACNERQKVIKEKMEANALKGHPAFSVLKKLKQ